MRRMPFSSTKQLEEQASTTALSFYSSTLQISLAGSSNNRSTLSHGMEFLYVFHLMF